MRLSILICLPLALLAANAAPAQTPTAPIVAEPAVLTQGYYRSQPQAAWLPGADAPLSDGPVSTMYLRFYADGRVIGVSSTGTPEQIVAWFDYSNDSLPRGEYRVEGDRLTFSTGSELGSVDYEGRIDGGTLHLKSHSHINGRDNTHTLRYVPMPALP